MENKPHSHHKTHESLQHLTTAVLLIKILFFFNHSVCAPTHFGKALNLIFPKHLWLWSRDDSESQFPQGTSGTMTPYSCIKYEQNKNASQIMSRSCCLRTQARLIGFILQWLINYSFLSSYSKNLEAFPTKRNEAYKMPSKIKKMRQEKRKQRGGEKATCM